MAGKVETKVPLFLAPVLLVSVHLISALDLESAKETECFEIKNTIRPGDNWAKASPAPMYYPLMSRLDLYLATKELTKRDLKDIGEDELYYEACFHFESHDNKTCIMRGFNGLKSEFEIKSHDENTGIMTFGPKEGEEGWSGKCYNTLTDNKTFIFTACCSKDNQMSWGAVSNVKSLPKDTVKKIHDHALSLGFKKEFFTSLRYDTCGDLNVKVGTIEKSGDSNDNITLRK